MKKIIVYAMSFLVVVNSFCQQPRPAQPGTSKDYLKKSKSQKTAAWILLGAGIISAGLLAGIETNPNSIVGGDNSHRTPFLVAGLAAIGTSIPLFIASGRNKRKAMSVSSYFDLRQMSVDRQPRLAYRPSPALLIKILF